VKPLTILYALLIFLSFNSLCGQDPQTSYPDPESGFALMRQFAENGRSDLAKQVGYRILEEEPGYHDVSLYLARVLGWEGSYDSAYILVDGVIEKDPGLLEAYVTGVDIAYWENDWLRLQDYAEAAFALDPDLPEVEKKYQLSRNQRALAREIPEIYFHYYYDHFGKPYARNWHMLTAGASVPLGNVTLLPYINGGYHAGGSTPSTDIQFNLDGYLNLGKKNYALLGYGFSPDGTLNYLPVHRGIAEIWQALPAGFSISAGVRYFYWDESFTFLTLSAEKYLGDYWFSLRNYLFFKDYGPSASFYLTARRYFGDIFNYLALTAGYGTAPDEPLLVVSDLDRLNAVSLRAELSRQITEKLRLVGMVGYAYEEYADQMFRNRIDLKVGIYIRLDK
jgi:YaiO family outer membrane protein